MKRVTFFLGFSMFSIMAFGQEESCSCTDNPWSAFAYMINEVHESLPPTQEELTAGFQFNNSWSEENYLEETVFEESNNNQSVAGIPDNWNFNLNRTKPVEIIFQTPDLLTELPKQKGIIEEEVIDSPKFGQQEKEEEGELAEIKAVEPINKKQPSRRNIDRNLVDKKDNSEKNAVSNSRSYSSPKIKTKKKMKFPRLKKQKKPKKYKGKCPLF